MKRKTKRIFDIILSLILLVLLSPVLILTSILIKITSQGPILYKWKIIGKDHKRIISYKFRSMICNAEAIENNMRNNGINEMRDVYFKQKNDSRVTKVGLVIRKFSVDELPTLFSVLKGDLSFVGPRPVRWHEYELLSEKHKFRFDIQPGLTSPWVVNGKNKIIDFDKVAELDRKYIENASVLYDLKIILKTIPIIIFGKNY